MAPKEELPPTLTVEQTGEILGVSRQSAYAGVRSGAIPSIKIGRRYVVPTAALMRLLGVEQEVKFDSKAAV